MIGLPQWKGLLRSKNWKRFKLLLIVSGSLGLIRFTKSTNFADIYTIISRPFWPGSAQKEWIKSGIFLEEKTKLKLLEKDNERLRTLLNLQNN